MMFELEVNRTLKNVRNIYKEGLKINLQSY